MQTVAPDGSISRYVFDANVTTVIDPAGHSKRFESDGFGNLTKVTESPIIVLHFLDADGLPTGSGTTTGKLKLVTDYTYDWLGHLTGVSMMRFNTLSQQFKTQTRTFRYGETGHVPQGNDSSFFWGLNDLTSTTLPETGTTNYYYNDDHSLDYKIDAKNQKIKYTYDGMKRVVVVQHLTDANNASSEDLCQRVVNSYDDIGLSTLGFGNGNGRLMQVQTGGTGCASTGNWVVTEQYGYKLHGADDEEAAALRCQAARRTARWMRGGRMTMKGT